MELEKTSAQYGCTCICNSEQKATAGKLSRAGKCLASSSWKLGMLSSAPSTGHRCRIACARSARVASPPCMQEIRGRSTLPLEKLPDLQQGRELAGGGHCGSTPSVLRPLQESGVKGRKEIATFFYSPPQRVQFIKMGTN